MVTCRYIIGPIIGTLFHLFCRNKGSHLLTSWFIDLKGSKTPNIGPLLNVENKNIFLKLYLGKCTYLYLPTTIQYNIMENRYAYLILLAFLQGFFMIIVLYHYPLIYTSVLVRLGFLYKICHPFLILE